MQPTQMNPIQHTDDLVTKSCKVADIYGERTLNNVSPEGVDAFICHRLRRLREQNPQAHVTYIVYQAESPRSIQQGAGSVPNNNRGIYNAGDLFSQKRWNNSSTVNVIIINTDTTTSTSSTSKPRSKLPPIRCISSPQAQATLTSSASSSSSAMPSVNLFFCEICCNQSHLAPRYLLLAQDSLVQLATIRTHHVQTLTGETSSLVRALPNNRIRRWRDLRGGFSSPDRNIHLSQTQGNTAHAQRH